MNMPKRVGLQFTVITTSTSRSDVARETVPDHETNNSKRQVPDTDSTRRTDV